MTEAVIVAGARTPIGRAHDTTEAALAAAAVGAALRRAGIPQGELDDVQLAAAGWGLARRVADDLGLPGVPGGGGDRHDGAGLDTVLAAVAAIRAGMDRAVVAGGAGVAGEGGPDTALVAAGEQAARAGGVTREAADAWARRAHERAARARDEGTFEPEIVPIDGLPGDELPRADLTADELAAQPALDEEGGDKAVVTAGNAAPAASGAAAVALTAADYAAAHGLVPLARVVSWARVGVDADRTGLAPAAAADRALERAGLTPAEVGVWELDEATAAGAAASAAALGLDPERVNVNGGACALGRPGTAEGARLVVSAVYELRRRGARAACVAVSSDPRTGAALVLELL